ncbi:MAG: hypothetical protein IPN01_36180 [Deltaproteobacteria bacterium]|nr:hypothetical protein [Deltaproteobacteria bacterium]
MQDLALLAGTPHGKRLEEWAEGATQIHVFVSFLFPEGVKLVKTLLKHAPVDLIVSTYLRATRKQALVDLLAVLKRTKAKANKLQVKVATGDKTASTANFTGLCMPMAPRGWWSARRTSQDRASMGGASSR